MTDYWPWWAGAIGLALTVIGYTAATGRSFGVSSAWERVLHWRAERRVERLDEQFVDDRALAEALAAATAEHFGPTSQARSGGPPAAPGGALQAPPVPVPSMPQRPAPLVTQAALLGSIFLGGLLASLTAGRFDLRLDMGDGFREVVTGNPALMVCALFIGGVLVGFGTRLAGGCSSGHGLSGCGRRQPVSLLATAVFFGTAVVVSLLLWKVV